MSAKDGEGERPRFLAEPGLDTAVAAILRLAMELSVLRDRLDAHEALAERTGAYTSEDVEGFTPPPDRAARRAAERKRLVEGLMRDLGQAGDSRA